MLALLEYNRFCGCICRRDLMIAHSVDDNGFYTLLYECSGCGATWLGDSHNFTAICAWNGREEARP